MDIATLEAAFRATIYRVETPEGRFDLRIGVADAAFDDYLRRQGVSCWGIITACNPGAVHLSNKKNQARQTRLRERLASAGWRFLAACNLDVAGVWPPEPACFILQMEEGLLCALAAEFAQLAVVCGEPGLPPCLLWIPAGGGEPV